MPFDSSAIASNNFYMEDEVLREFVVVWELRIGCDEYD